MMNTRLFRIGELIVLFAGVPLLYYYHLIPIPKIIVLLLMTLYCLFSIRKAGNGRWESLLNWPDTSGMIIPLLLRTALVALAILGITLWLESAHLFSFPRSTPGVWALVMVLYPLLSALPQELIYRVYFFDRFAPLWNVPWMGRVASAAAFSFLHIIYGNLPALVLSFIGGLMFSQTYRRTDSLLWVALEHALYGCLIFTIGLGTFFYDGG